MRTNEKDSTKGSPNTNPRDSLRVSAGYHYAIDAGHAGRPAPYIWSAGVTNVARTSSIPVTAQAEMTAARSAYPTETKGMSDDQLWRFAHGLKAFRNAAQPTKTRPNGSDPIHLARVYALGLKRSKADGTTCIPAFLSSATSDAFGDASAFAAIPHRNKKVPQSDRFLRGSRAWNNPNGRKAHTAAANAALAAQTAQTATVAAQIPNLAAMAASVTE